MASASGLNVQAGCRPGAHQLRGARQLGADDADLDAVDGEHLRRLQIARQLAGGVVDDVGGQERERRPCDVRLQAVHAVVELVVAERRGVEAPGVLDVDRRHVLEQARVGRRRTDVVAGGEQQRRVRAAAPPPRRTSSPAATPRRPARSGRRSARSSGRAGRGSRSGRPARSA